jgi:hypothetical protein
MNRFINNLSLGDLVGARESLKEQLQNLISEKLNQLKLRIASEMYGDDVEYELVDEAVNRNIQKMGRTKMVRVRIRGGKIQRRKKLSAVKGYTIRAGKLTRMSAQERRHRKMAARRSKFKRRAKLQQSLRKRKRSLLRRRALGI